MKETTAFLDATFYIMRRFNRRKVSRQTIPDIRLAIMYKASRQLRDLCMQEIKQREQ